MKNIDNFTTITDNDAAEKKEKLEKGIETMLFDYPFLLAWSASTSWADMSEFLEEQDNGHVDPDIVKEMQILRNMFLLCVTALHSNPFSLGITIAIYSMFLHICLLPILIRSSL